MEEMMGGNVEAYFDAESARIERRRKEALREKSELELEILEEELDRLERKSSDIDSIRVAVRVATEALQREIDRLKQ